MRNRSKKCVYTGSFIMFSVITNICNKKTKGPYLMEFFTVTGKLKKFFFITRYVRCVHHWWKGTHRYDNQVLATHACVSSTVTYRTERCCSSKIRNNCRKISWFMCLYRRSLWHRVNELQTHSFILKFLIETVTANEYQKLIMNCEEGGDSHCISRSSQVLTCTRSSIA